MKNMNWKLVAMLLALGAFVLSACWKNDRAKDQAAIPRDPAQDKAPERVAPGGAPDAPALVVVRGSDTGKGAFQDGISRTPKLRTPALEVLVLEVVPGAALKSHDMPCKVAFYVIEGSGTFTFGEEVVTVEPGDMVQARPGRPRFWANRSDKPLRLLVIKSLAEE